MPRRAAKAQAAIDFISTYGFVILIIAITIYAVLQLGVFNYAASPQYCYSQYPFSCIAYSLNTSGGLVVVISQNSGGVMNITGVACSSVPNTTRIGPKYGNVMVGANTVFYPNNVIANGITLYPGAQATIYAKCYSNNLGPSTSVIGGTFTGYLWVKYTFSELPSTYNNIGQMATINVKYT